MLVETKEELQKIIKEKPALMGILSDISFLELPLEKRIKLIEDKNFAIIIYENLDELKEISLILPQHELLPGNLFTLSKYKKRYYGIDKIFKELPMELINCYAEILPYLGAKYIEMVYDVSFHEMYKKETEETKKIEGEAKVKKESINVGVSGEVKSANQDKLNKIYQELKSIKDIRHLRKVTKNFQLAKEKILKYNLTDDPIIEDLLNNAETSARVEREILAKTIFSQTFSQFKHLKVNFEIDLLKVFSLQSGYINVILSTETRKKIEEIKFKLIVEFY